MALPTLEQLRQGATTWKRERHGVGYTLSHHGVSSYSPEGTWCFYIHLLEEQFVSADQFAMFDREPEVREWAGSHREHYPYDDVPDFGFHGGITWYSRETYVARDGRRMKALKIGCDYAHAWDRDGGYWQGLDDVEADAKALIDRLVREVRIKERCSYSGQYDVPEQFYTARNGCRVHVSQATKFSEDEWPTWLPAESGPSGAQGTELSTLPGMDPSFNQEPGKGEG